MERLIGRQADLEALWRAFESAARGRGRVLLVSGEGGIGKTTLLEGFGRRAEAEGARTVWGRCWDGEGAPAYWPIWQLLRGLSDASELPHELRRLEPRSGDMLELEFERFSVFDAVATYLDGVAAASPLVLLLDDLHWADLQTLLLLKRVARTLDRSRILLAGTYREAEARASGERRRLLGDIERSGRTLPLRGLSVGEVAEMAPREIAGELHEMTGGNPFFIDEILRLWSAMRHQSGAKLSDLPLPDGVRDVIRQRLEALPPDAQRCLSVASVLGRELKTELVDAILGAPALDSIDVAVRHDLVVRGPSPGSYRFRHDLIRETLYGDLGERERAVYHRRAMDALDTLRGDQHNPAELAHHAVLALPAGGDRRVAANLCVRAGRDAARLLAFEQAVAHHRTALELIETDAPLQVETLLDCAEAQLASGDPVGAKASSRRAAELAEAHGLYALYARAALCFGSRPAFGEVDRELVGLLRGSLRLLPDDERALRAMVTGRLAAAMQPSPQPDEPIALAKEAISLARALGDPRTCATTLALARAAFRVVDSLEDRSAIDEETLALGERLGDELLQAQAHKRLLHDRLEAGDRVGSDLHVEAFERLATRLGRIDLIAEAETIRAMRASLEGRFDDAQTHLSAHGLPASLTVQLHNPRAATVVTRICFDPNDPAGARAARRELAQAALEAGFPPARLGNGAPALDSSWTRRLARALDPRGTFGLGRYGSAES